MIEVPFSAKKESIRIDSSRKVASSVHFNNYMKGTKRVREKVRVAIEEEREVREQREREERDRA